MKIRDASRFVMKLEVVARFMRDLSSLSTDPRIKCSAVVVPYDFSEVLGIGYNGVPRGISHDDVPQSDVNLPGASGMAHAELNALVKMNTRSAPACLMLCTHSPCPTCAAAIVNSGCVTAVMYDQRYDSPIASRGLDVLSKGEVWWDEYVPEALVLGINSGRVRQYER